MKKTKMGGPPRARTARAPTAKREKSRPPRCVSGAEKQGGWAGEPPPPAPAEKNSAIPPTTHLTRIDNLTRRFHMVAIKWNTRMADAATPASFPPMQPVFSVTDIPHA